MDIILSQNLRKLRKDRGLTQEELAGFLGISPQAVSKWERDEGYPDITMLPVIANYFAVTVDELIGSDLADRDTRVKMYVDEFDRLCQTRQFDLAYELAEKAYREYPYEWWIIYNYIASITRQDQIMPTPEKLAEMRALAKLIIDKCPIGDIRRLTTYRMLYAEDDDKVEFWFDQVTGTYDFTDWERREERYLLRGHMEEYFRQKRSNMRQLFQYLIDKLHHDNDTPEKRVTAYEHLLALEKAMFQGKNAEIHLDWIAAYEGQLAEAYAEIGRIAKAEELYKAAVRDFDEWFAIPSGTEMHFAGIFEGDTRVKKDGDRASCVGSEEKIRMKLAEIAEKIESVKKA